ncbi:MAG: putative membrane protein [Chlamydiales bacterium]|jgi:putative membrane protein
MGFIKLLHLICLFTWIGNLMCLTRLMGYHAKEDAATQAHLARLYRRMYKLVSLPTMCLTILLGIVLITSLPTGPSMGWLHMKLTFALGMVVVDIICGREITRLNEGHITGRGVKYKILHGVTGLLLIGILSASVLVRDKEGEIRFKLANEVSEKVAFPAKEHASFFNSEKTQAL